MATEKAIADVPFLEEADVGIVEEAQVGVEEEDGALWGLGGRGARRRALCGRHGHGGGSRRSRRRRRCRCREQEWTEGGRGPVDAEAVFWSERPSTQRTPTPNPASESSPPTWSCLIRTPGTQARSILGKSDVHAVLLGHRRSSLSRSHSIAPVCLARSHRLRRQLQSTPS